ncbi:MAG: hypothetical protein PHW96_02230 [Candidatus Nanoarchaeia archaeon]|nr:hypothetical protein [Candidatus Nanoarchaeia archaeon]
MKTETFLLALGVTMMFGFLFAMGSSTISGMALLKIESSVEVYASGKPGGYVFCTVENTGNYRDAFEVKAVVFDNELNNQFYSKIISLDSGEKTTISFKFNTESFDYSSKRVSCYILD